MPVRWTSDLDQLLLLKILETHELSVDAKRVSGSWPADKGEVPTARAITERLVKIRNDARKNGALTSHFGISSSQTKSSSGKYGTPRKTATVGKAGADLLAVSTDVGPHRSPVSPTPRPKGKRVVKKEDDSDSDMQILSAERPSFDDDELPYLKTILSTPLRMPLSTPRRLLKATTSSDRSIADLADYMHSHIDDDIAAGPIKQPDFTTGGRAVSRDLDGLSDAGRQKRAVAFQTKRYISDGDDGAESDVSDFEISKQFRDQQQSEDL